MANKPKNPFLHTHDHDHDHAHGHSHDDHGEADFSAPFDPAQQSLAEALRISFTLLKVVMVILLVIYLLSGFFNVKSNESAVRLRFGSIVEVDQSGRKEIDAGGPYFAFPYPIEEVVKIPTAPRTLELNQQFWHQQQEEQLAQGPLNPERDGSLLTGDANIVHARWTLTYNISGPVDYLTHVGSPDLAEQIVRNAAEQGLVHTVARLSIDEIMRGQNYSDTARIIIQEQLDAMNSGITVQQVSLARRAIPGSVRRSYEAVILAQSERGQAIEAAQKERSSILNTAAGEAYEPLWKLIVAYEQAVDLEDHVEANRLAAEIDAAYSTLSIPAERGPAPVGGRVAEIVNAAQTYRTQVVEQVKAEANTFNMLLPQYRENPNIVLSRLWQEARERILSGDVETFYLPPGQPRVILNRDPKVAQMREERMLREQQERQRNPGAGSSTTFTPSPTTPPPAPMP